VGCLCSEVRCTTLCVLSQEIRTSSLSVCKYTQVNPADRFMFATARLLVEKASTLRWLQILKSLFIQKHKLVLNANIPSMPCTWQSFVYQPWRHMPSTPARIGLSHVTANASRPCSATINVFVHIFTALFSPLTTKAKKKSAAARISPPCATVITEASSLWLSFR